MSPHGSDEIDVHTHPALPDAVAIATSEADNIRNRQAARYTNRFDDSLIRFTAKAEQTGNVLRAFYLRLEAKRHASPHGDMIGLLLLSAILLGVGVIGTWFLGAVFWVFSAIAAFFSFFPQIKVGYISNDFNGTDLATISRPRRIAIFFHSSFATSEGIARNLCGFAALSIVIAIIIAIIP